MEKFKNIRRSISMLVIVAQMAVLGGCAGATSAESTRRRPYTAQIEGVPGVQLVEIDADEEHGAAQVRIGNQQLPPVAIPNGALTRIADNRYEFRSEQGVTVPITVLGSGRYEIAAGGRSIIITLAEQAAEAPTQGVGQQRNEYVWILAAGVVGVALVATCGSMAYWSCGWRGVKNWGVYSFSTGLCWVECR